MLSDAAIRERCAVLAETAGHIGDPQVRNRGTIGGALAHADPAADYPATILALDAEIVAQGPTGPPDDHRRPSSSPACFTTALAPDELLVEVRVPVIGQGSGGAYAEAPQPASHYAVVGVAAVVRLEGGRVTGVRIGVTGAGAQPSRARRGRAGAARSGSHRRRDRPSGRARPPTGSTC